MCGLYGAFGFIGPEEKKVLKMLSMVSQLRGRDSCGVALIPCGKKPGIVIAKALGGQESLVYENEEVFNQSTWEMKVLGLQCVIGHHRHATMGSVDIDSAHPFEFDNIVGAHNGTVYRHDLYHLDSYATDLIDSQIMLKELDSGTAPADMVEFMGGAWALTWWNKKKNNLHMCRNDKRELHIMQTINKKTLFWSSEDWPLHAVNYRYNLKIPQDEIKSVVADRHLIWVKGGDGKVSLKSSTPAVGGKINRVSYYNPWANPSYVGPKESIDKEVRKEKTRRQQKQESNVVCLPNGPQQEVFEEDYARTFEELWVGKREFNKRIKDGCNWCETALCWEDRKTITWYAEDEPVCGPCENEIVRQMNSGKAN